MADQTSNVPADPCRNAYLVCEREAGSDQLKLARCLFEYLHCKLNNVQAEVRALREQVNKPKP